ncbi:MAG TPA: PstS family phosphate ABC transporter substrate-binding protein [Mycobacteriales bacterium]|nr:PstS family phosphate ABC transporter substrate-binding protein [Mycobacteriales bacterium]
MLSRQRGLRRSAAVVLGLTIAISGCSSDAEPNSVDTGSSSTGAGSVAELAGTISGDGSSTVFPIMEAVAEDFGGANPDVKIQVGESGTGGGFEKFCAGETDFSNASRAIKDEEKAACEAKGVAFTEFKIASDGLAVVSNKDLKVDCLTVDELKKTFLAGSTVKKFSDIKADLPSTEVKLFTPGADSGTYDFFLEEILGKEGKFRADGVTTSEDDNVLVTGIDGSKGGLGFFGFSYYTENKDKLNLVGVDGGKGCVEPSTETVLDGSYDPLSRPLFIYVKNDSLARPEVKAMMRFVLTDGRELIDEVGYVQLPDADYQTALAKLT